MCFGVCVCVCVCRVVCTCRVISVVQIIYCIVAGFRPDVVGQGWWV